MILPLAGTLIGQYNLILSYLILYSIIQTSPHLNLHLFKVVLFVSLVRATDTKEKYRACPPYCRPHVSKFNRC